MDQREPLGGGLANAGAVFRRGVVVRRPAPVHAAAVHEFLTGVVATGFSGAPSPRRLSSEGWEELEFIQGDVGVQPYPAWVMADDVLASVGRLLRRYHDAAASVPVDVAVSWPTDLADPEGGPVVTHNDVCVENVVFRDGGATALIDFDFAAPGRPVWDLAMTARYWVPTLDARSAAATGRGHLDPFPRFRILVDGYGLGVEDRMALVDVMQPAHEVCRSFVSARVARGEPGFVSALETTGGWERWDRVGAWLAENRQRFADTLAEG